MNITKKVKNIFLFCRMSFGEGKGGAALLLRLLYAVLALWLP